MNPLSRYWSTTVACLPFSLRRRFFAQTLPEPLPEVWVVSPGGVGTTTMMRHIARFRRTNAPDDSDQLKHLPRPPRLPRDGGARFLFITGPEDDIYASLARRGWIEDQAANLGAPLAVLSRGRLQRFFFIRAIRRQLRTWKARAPFDVLYLDYSEVFEAGPRIAAFLGITDAAFVARYPRRKNRSRKD